MCSVLIAPVRNEEGTAVMYIVNHEDVTWSPNMDEVISSSMALYISWAFFFFLGGGGVMGVCYSARIFF